MNDMIDEQAIPVEERENASRELRDYCVGFALAVALTVASFALVVGDWVSGGTAMAILGALALAQIVVHFRFFLHIDLQKSHRDDLQLILFTALIVLLMVGGTIWILWNQHARMMG